MVLWRNHPKDLGKRKINLLSIYKSNAKVNQAKLIWFVFVLVWFSSKTKLIGLVRLLPQNEANYTPSITF